MTGFFGNSNIWEEQPHLEFPLEVLSPYKSLDGGLRHPLPVEKSWKSGMPPLPPPAPPPFPVFLKSRISGRPTARGGGRLWICFIPGFVLGNKGGQRPQIPGMMRFSKRKKVAEGGRGAGPAGEAKNAGIPGFGPGCGILWPL